MIWGLPIAVYLFLAGTGAGAFLTAAVAEAYAPEKFRSLSRAGLLASGPLVALGMPFLIMDLGIGLRQPWRIVFLLSNFNSIMTWGVYILSTFIPVALLCGILELDIALPWPSIEAKRQYMIAHWKRPLIGIGTLFAFSTSIYTGLLIGMIRAVPLWNTPILPPLFVVSALSSGLAAAAIIATLAPVEDRELVAEHFFHLNQVHSAMIIAELIFLFCWLFLTSAASVSASRSVNELLSGRLAVPFWFGIVLFGIVDPLIIYIYEVVLRRPLAHYMMIVSDGSVLVGGMVLRYLVLAAAVPVVLGS